MKNVNVYSYLRWSSEPQTWGDSERRQLEAASAWCALRGLKLSEDRFIDRGVSAKDGRNQQAQLGRLLGVVKSGDYLLVEDADRLSRQDWKASMDFLEKIVSKGAVVVTMQNGVEIDEEGFRCNPGVFLPTILKAFTAHDENQKKSFRIKASWTARKAAVRDGKPLNQNLPGWLHYNRATKQITLIEERAAVVRRIFRLYLQGQSLFFVARQLNAEGAVRVSRQGKRHGTPLTGFSTSLVHRVLTNRAVLGECLGVLGLWPPVVAEPDFYAVAARLKAGQRQTVPLKAAADNLFIGLAVCAKCSGPLHKHSQKRNGKTYPYMLCGRTLRGEGSCGFASIRYDWLEDNLLAMLSNSDLVRRALADQPVQPNNLDVIKGKLAAAQERANKLLAAIEEDDHPARRVMERLKQLEADETALSEQVEAESAKVKGQKPGLSAYAEILDLSSRVKEPETRLRLRSALPWLIERVAVELGQNNYTIDFVGGGKITLKLRRNGDIEEMLLLDYHKLPSLAGSALTPGESRNDGDGLV